ncbi:hypothetical protein AALP_AA3G268700 [Arabis alpina]|uniref:Uncharacterized protein n=1 Tax=Arabis alpina TaxID=50452 RepID=A0A087HBX9_ARAAL|nr:hypothetical protein AALP_AA3G268700 [Arabis alpina]
MQHDSVIKWLVSSTETHAFLELYACPFLSVCASADVERFEAMWMMTHSSNPANLNVCKL